MDFLNSITNGFSNIESIREQLFEVKKLKLHTGLEGFESPDAYGTFKNTGGIALGVVGKDFEPQQPTFIFDNFVDALVDANADLSTLTYTELKGGRRIMLSADIGNFQYTNLRGFKDELKSRINITTGFDGSTKTSMFLSTYRMVCANGMKAWKTEFSVSFKNTKGNIGKANLLCSDVAKAINSQKEYKEFLEVLTKKEISKKEHNEFIKRVTGYDIAEYNDMTTRSRNIIDKINQAVAIERKEAGATAWALLNGITRYTNHMVKRTETDRIDYIYADQGSKLNDTAQHVAFEMFAN